MVCMPANIRNLTQILGGDLMPLAKAADAITKTQSPAAKASHTAVDALSELLAGTAFIPDAAPAPRHTTYEQTGYPDLLAQLWALVDRPVGKGVLRTTANKAVATEFGTVMVEVESAEYVNRPLTPEEILYLRRKGRLQGNHPVPGDLDYLTQPEGH